MRKTACPVVWERWRAQSRHPDPFRALPLPDISEFDDEEMIANHKTIAIVKHRNVGHEQHVPARLMSWQVNKTAITRVTLSTW
jgi:hypothetical protein